MNAPAISGDALTGTRQGVKAAIEALVVAALNVLDEKLTPEQRLDAEEVYELANRLEYSLEPEVTLSATELEAAQLGVSVEQLFALIDWRNFHGRTWRAKLLTAWERAGAGYLKYSPALQQLRNDKGPTWLARAKL